MTNYSFKMGTFSFRFLENFCQLQLSVGKQSVPTVWRSSQNDLTGSPISSGQAELESIKSLNSCDSSREKEKNLPEAGKFSSYILIAIFLQDSRSQLYCLLGLFPSSFFLSVSRRSTLPAVP